MSSSDDDVPLSRGHKPNGNMGTAFPSKEMIPESLDNQMDIEQPSGHTSRTGVAIRNGPVSVMEVDEPEAQVNGVSNGKRKGRRSSGPVRNYAELASSEEDEQPLSKKRRTANGSAAKRRSKVVEDDSDDEPLSSKKTGSIRKIVKKPQKITPEEVGEEDDDVPIADKLAKTKAAIQRSAAKEAPKLRKAEKNGAASAGNGSRRIKKEESDEETPVKPRRKSNGVSAATSKKKANGIKKEESEDDSDAPLSGKKTKKKANGTTKAKPEKKAKSSGKVKKEESPDDADINEEEDSYRWWEDPAIVDGTVKEKWDTLEHNGVVFPPEYEPLPKNVKMLYDGNPVTLAPEAEEVAGFFGAMLNSTHNVENPRFIKNFFHDFQKVIAETKEPPKDQNGRIVKIETFEKCDFKPIFNYYDAKREEKKALPSAEKKALKAEKDAAEAPYMYCTWNGRQEKVGNFRVEPPGLFRGRGDHPKTGHLKKRVYPEQITINIGKEATTPTPPKGHKWKEIKHDQSATWLAMWQENINGAYKYVMLAANSTIKGLSDYKKREKRENSRLVAPSINVAGKLLKQPQKYIDFIRDDYKKNLRAEKMADRQLATAVYLIDQFALRAGNEKGDDEADTVGCCSLKFEHVTLKPPNKVVFDFLGKDSIRFFDEVEVIDQVFKNLKIFKKSPKGPGDDIFDRVTTTQLNKHLGEYMPGLSAKVFRTYNASVTMAELLNKMKPKGSIHEKVKEYNDANRTVAILCNHKRTVTESHAGQMEKMEDKIKGLQYQKWRLKQMILDVEPKQKKKKGADWFELDEGLDEEWILEHQKALADELRAKIEKKFNKENENLEAGGKKPLKDKDLKDRLEAVKVLESKYKKENKSKKVEAEPQNTTVEKLEANVQKMDERVEVMRLQALDKDANKEIALGTSKINYIDPRLTVVFSKRFGVPIEKFFSKTLREKFNWAIQSAEEDWVF